MKYLSFLTLILTFLYPNVSYGFLNIESLRQSKNYTETFKGSTQLGASDTNGNVNKTILGLSTLNMVNLKKSNFIFLGSYNYGKSTGVEDVNDGHIHFRYTRNLSKGLYLELFQQTEFDKFQDLNARYLFGSGLRQRLFEATRHAVFVGAGAFYEKEELQDS